MTDDGCVNIGVTKVGEHWVTFRRRDDNPATDTFWDGHRWVKNVADAVAHETLGEGLTDLFSEHPTASIEISIEGQRETEMDDPTEDIRREQVQQVNAEPGSREALEAEHGQVWDTGQLAADFEVLGFMAPYVVTKRKSDGKKGSLLFQHQPRFYFSFQPE